MTKNKFNPILLLLTGLLCLSSVKAQESANSSGGDVSGSGGSVAYSVGQIVYIYNNGANGSETQGIQQVYDISIISNINETALNISLNAFPNPTADHLNLLISDYNNEKLSYQLFDIEGKNLISGQILNQQTQINMNSLPKATYFVHIVNQENNKVQSFKIVKQ